MESKLIGYRIKTARENTHITQEQLAEIIGCTTQHISAMERGIKLPRLDTFVCIANALHISSDVLLQDFLKCAPNPLASEFASAISPLSREMQLHILKAIRAFAQGIAEE
ncbi:MAG: helix-turn-helix domain-containing protein [Faecousia sp.]